MAKRISLPEAVAAQGKAAQEFIALIARMKLEGECEKCGWIDPENPSQDGGTCTKCGGDLFYLSNEDALSTCNELIASARQIQEANHAH